MGATFLMPLNYKHSPEMQTEIVRQNHSRIANTEQWQTVAVTMDMKKPEPQTLPNVNQCGSSNHGKLSR